MHSVYIGINHSIQSFLSCLCSSFYRLCEELG
nr:MAG TPA: hypothetical protein [Bacteriophage sp.]